MIHISPRLSSRSAAAPDVPLRLPPGFCGPHCPWGSPVSWAACSSHQRGLRPDWLSTPTARGVFALAFGLAVRRLRAWRSLRRSPRPSHLGLREVEASAAPDAFCRVIRAGSTVAGLIVAVAVVPLAAPVPGSTAGSSPRPHRLFIALSLAGALVLTATPAVAFVSARLSAGALLRADVVALAVDVALAVALVPRIGLWGPSSPTSQGRCSALPCSGAPRSVCSGCPSASLCRDSAPLLVGAGHRVSRRPSPRRGWAATPGCVPLPRDSRACSSTSAGCDSSTSA